MRGTIARPESLAVDGKKIGDDPSFAGDHRTESAWMHSSRRVAL